MDKVLYLATLLRARTPLSLSAHTGSDVLPSGPIMRKSLAGRSRPLSSATRTGSTSGRPVAEVRPARPASRQEPSASAAAPTAALLVEQRLAALVSPVWKPCAAGFGGGGASGGVGGEHRAAGDGGS